MATIIAGIDAGGTSVRIQYASVDGSLLDESVTVAATPDGEPPTLALFPGTVAAVCAGIAKFTRPGVADAWRETLAARFPGAAVTVVPDYEIAFHAGVPEGNGVCVVAGTGSVAYGENASTGQAVRVGGRGFEWGDEGSGAWLTTEMVRRTLRALDGQAPMTTLTEAVCADLQTTDPATLAGAARTGATDTGRGFLLPLLVRLQDAGEREAHDLFVGAGGWLASLGTAAAGRLGFAGEGAETFAVAGGVWKAGGDTVREAFALAVRRRFPRAIFLLDAPPPVLGAVRLAKKRSEMM